MTDHSSLIWVRLTSESLPALRSNEMFTPAHRYLNVTGGFLVGQVNRMNHSPVLVFKHYNVDGNILNTDTLKITDPG